LQGSYKNIITYNNIQIDNNLAIFKRKQKSKISVRIKQKEDLTIKENIKGAIQTIKTSRY
jgi:hypothetical protein